MNLTAAKIVDIPTDDGLFELSQKEFGEIAELVGNECGINLTSAKYGLIVTRLQKRIRALNMSSFSEYIAFLKSKAGAVEIEEMISKITTNVTSFNREPHHFDHFRNNVLPGLIEKAQSGHSVRLWSAGCSDGREPYTLACLILDAFPEVLKHDFRILATDIDKHSLQKAKSGVYSREMLNSLPTGSAETWFDCDGNDFRVKDQVKKLIQFNLLNLMAEWPMKKKIDAIFCRNVMIYFATDVQVQLLKRFSSYLPVGSHLYLGHSERIEGEAMALFKQVGVTTYVHQSGGSHL